MKTIRLEIPDTLYERMVRKMGRDGFRGASASSWRRWFSSLCGDTLLFPTVEKEAASAEGLLPMWMKSFGKNLPDMWSGRDLRELKGSADTRRCVVVGRGPSVFRRNHLKALAGSRDGVCVVATDGMLIECVKAGILPDYVVTVDGSDVCNKWYDPKMLRSTSLAGKTKAILCSQTARTVVMLVEAAKMPIYWYHPATDLISMPNSLTRALLYMTVSEKHPDGLLAIYCGGNIGTTSLMIAMNILGSRDIALIGFDFSYPADMPLTETYYYDRAVEHSGYLQTGTMYDDHVHPVFGTRARTDPVFRSYRDSLYEQLEQLPEGMQITNCTEGGILHHRNMPCTTFGEWLKG